LFISGSKNCKTEGRAKKNEAEARESGQGSNGGEMTTSTEPEIRGGSSPLTADDGIAIERAESGARPYRSSGLTGDPNKVDPHGGEES
jgi:hypothetical protein